jgi:hypothetical protein
LLLLSQVIIFFVVNLPNATLDRHIGVRIPGGQPKLFPSRISHLFSSSTQQSNPSAFPLQCLISERDGTVLDHVAFQLLFSDGFDKKYLLD